MAMTFDFGSGMALPPIQANSSKTRQGGTKKKRKGKNAKPVPVENPRSRTALPTTDLAHKFKPRLEDGSVATISRIPSFVERADDELLDYLHGRNISETFLHDIDDFLAEYPQLVTGCASWSHKIATLPPLDAYLFFVRGYLRPARYRTGALPPPDQLMVPKRPLQLQTTAFDTELLDFFKDCGECFTILNEMDHEVTRLANDYHSGHQLPNNQLHFLTLAVYGQPVDALKFYEYCYQTDYLPHRNLGEHNILNLLPKQAVEHRELQPCMRTVKKNYWVIRKAMARARDKHRNVEFVLLNHFADFLKWCAIPEEEIRRYCGMAEQTIEDERRASTGKDVVDMVMSLAHKIRHQRLQAQKAPGRRRNPRKPARRSRPNVDPDHDFKVRTAAIATHRLKLEALYNREAREGPSDGLMRAQKVEEYRLATIVGTTATKRKVMNVHEHQFLLSLFPERTFMRLEEYDEVNPERWDVLVLLKKWL